MRKAVRWEAWLMVSLVIGCRVSVLWAQAPQPEPRSLTLQQAVEHALEHYPSVRVALERAQGAQGQIDLARTNYLPTSNLLWQSNRATANNIFGLLLPQGVIPPISGPVLPTTSNRTVWGSAAGVLFSWEPLDFGYRRATVNAARAGENLAWSQANLTRLDVASEAAQAFISVLAAQQAARAARANVDRWEVVAKSVHVLVDNELRPGADASRADAELAVARTLWIQAQTAARVSHAALVNILGITGADVNLDAGPLLSAQPAEDLPVLPLASHPAATAQQAQVEQVKAQEQALNRSYVPRFFTQAALSGRGSGANPDGTDSPGLNGLGLERANYAAGITVTFPLFDYFSNRAQKKIVDAHQKAEAAQYDQTLQNLSEGVEQAQATLEGARKVAENTPVELAAARASEVQSQARYKAGLATLVDVSQAEGLLVQAEIDDALARLNLWRSFEGVAAAQGNLQPFLELLRRSAP
jgi:outer membrane protein